MKLFLALLLATLLASPAVAYEECVCRYCSAQRLAALEGDGPATLRFRKYAPDRTVDVLHLRIDVTPDFDARTIEAETAVSFAPISKPVQEVTLDAVELSIESVKATRPIAEHVATGRDVTILFEEPIPVGERVEVTFRYTAEPKQGLYFRTEAMGYPAGDDHLWTQGETHEARNWFPCFDYPNERSTTEVICRVPDGMTVLSNGRRVSDQIDPRTGLRAVHWRMDKPHVSYLVCLVAGYLHELDDRHRDLPLGFYTQPSLAEHAANSFADTAEILAFFEEEIGVPFPWPKYDQVTIRDFTAGGMENTTLTTLTHRTIFSPATEDLFTSRPLDAHETAHQWFGDYVTCEDWSQLWLNEGFATYYTHLYEEHKFGRDELLYRLHRDAASRILSAEKATLPIVYRGYKNAWEQFDFRAYPKGAWVLHMLRTRLGKEVYRTAIHRYLEKHALSSVVTADLVAELEDASGLSLDQFFDQWVYHGGVPKLKVRHRWLPKEKLARVTIEQTQTVNDDVLLFHVPTKMRFVVDGKAVDHAIDLRKAKQEFFVPLAKQPTIVRFDPELGVLADLDFEKPLAMLEAQLANHSDIIGRLRAAEALGEKKSKRTVAALQTALQSDPHYGVRIAAAKSLKKLHTDEAFAALTESLDQPSARVRKEVVASLGDFYRPEAEMLLNRVVNEDRNPGVAAAAVRALGKYQSEAAQSAIVTALAKPSLHERFAIEAFEAAQHQGDPALLRPVLKALHARGDDFDGRTWAAGLKAAARLATIGDDKAAARDAITAQLRHPKAPIQTAAIEALGELRDPTTLALVRARTDDANVRLARAAQAAVKKIETEAAFVPKELLQLRKLVRELEADQKKLQESVERLESKGEAEQP